MKVLDIADWKFGFGINVMDFLMIELTSSGLCYFDFSFFSSSYFSSIYSSNFSFTISKLLSFQMNDFVSFDILWDTFKL